jgi:hypothetical protein
MVRTLGRPGPALREPAHGGAAATPGLWSRPVGGRTVRLTVNWLTVEVFDGATSGAAWARAWQDSLVEAAVSRGAVFWDEHEHRWGVVLEFAFREEEQRDAFRESTLLRAALDTAPDPVNGVLAYPHRGGGTGARQPRRPRPLVQGGAAALPLPEPETEPLLGQLVSMPPSTGSVVPLT